MARSEVVCRGVARNTRKLCGYNQIVKELEGDVNEFGFMPKQEEFTKENM